MKANELAVQFVSAITDSETGEVTSHLYFITGGPADLIAKYVAIKSEKKPFLINTASGMYAYFSSKFIGNESTIEHVCNEKWNNFYPSRAWEKKVTALSQQAGRMFKNKESADTWFAKNYEAMEKASGRVYQYPAQPVLEQASLVETNDESMDDL